MSAESLFSKEELAEGTFYLLSSSSVDRYVRMAKEVAFRTNLFSQVQADPTLTVGVLHRARNLWSDVLSAQKRTLSEIELALVLPILARTAAPQVDGLLGALLVVERPSATWINALAKRLCGERVVNQNVPLPDYEIAKVPQIKFNIIPASSLRISREIEVELSCSRKVASQPPQPISL